MSACPQHRHPGRPRDPERDTAILAATLAVLAEAGVAGTTVEAVAARAGVGKATIYRRWPSREALVVDAVDSCVAPLPEADTGDVRGDVLALLDTIGRSRSLLPERLLPRILGDAGSNPELHRRFRERFVDPRRARLAAALRRGVERGELRTDLDVERAVDLLAGPVVYRRLLDANPGPLPRALVAGLVDDVLDGLRPR